MIDVCHDRDNRRTIRRECAEMLTTVTALPYYYAIHLNEPSNQRCIMCVPSGRHGRDALPLDRFLALFERIRTVAEHVTLIGGEPFTYPWIFSREVAGRSHLRLILVYGVIRSTSSLTGLPAANPGRFAASSRPSSASLSLRGDVRPALPEALRPCYDRWRALQIEPPPG